MQLSPIVLFVYNRPFHVIRTLESLSKNTLAGASELIVYSDGPKNPSDLMEAATIETVRDIVKSKKWCKSVKLICSDNNKGLKNSIVEGVSEVVHEYGKVIVLEDDLVLGRNFLSYMNESLALYVAKKRVMHISGYSLNMDKSGFSDTYFLPLICSWGWATWSDRWRMYMHDTQKIYDALIARNELERFTIYGSYKDLQHQLEANIDGRLDTWAIKWHGSTFLQNGLTLYPKHSLVKNIGFDNSGIHCNDDKSFDVDLYENASVEIKNMKVEESIMANTAVYIFFKRIQRLQSPSFLQRVLFRLQKMVS